MTIDPSRRSLFLGAGALGAGALGAEALGAGALALSGSLRAAAAETWPARPIKMIVGYPAGGANDLVARAVAGALSDALATQVVVDNRSGAAGAIGAEAAARSAPDGYTLYMMA